MIIESKMRNGGGYDASLRLFAVLGVLMMAIAALPVVCDDAADAAISATTGSGTPEDPYEGTLTFGRYSDLPEDVYVYQGTVFNGEIHDRNSPYEWTLTDGYGLSITEPIFINSKYKLTGTATNLGDCILYQDGEPLATFHIVDSAKFVATIRFHTEGGSGLPSDIVSENQDGVFSVTLPTTTPTWGSYPFLGWKDRATSTTYQPGQEIPLSGSVTLDLYAVWGKYTYKVDFDPNGGQGGPEDINRVTDATMITLAIYYEDMPHKDGYVCIGYDEDPNATDPKYKFGRSYTLSGNTDLKLYAIWEVYVPDLDFLSDPTDGTVTYIGT